MCSRNFTMSRGWSPRVRLGDLPREVFLLPYALYPTVGILSNLMAQNNGK